MVIRIQDLGITAIDKLSVEVEVEVEVKVRVT